MATLTTDDRGFMASANLQTPITVDCPTGCTLTQGYWKTHNLWFGADKKGGRKGPTGASLQLGSPGIVEVLYGYANARATGAVANAAPTIGDPTWFTNFVTPPKGNRYYQASHQFMAAMLNVANGASGAVINTELAAAYTFFLTADPATAWDDTQRTTLIGWSSLFGSYNEGNQCRRDSEYSGIRREDARQPPRERGNNDHRDRT